MFKDKLEQKIIYEPELWIMIYTLDSLLRKGITLQEGIRYSLEYLKILYEATSDSRYHNIALLEIKAYLVMGGQYIHNEEIFNYFLQNSGEEKNEILLKYGAKCVNLNKNQITGLIRKWRPSKDNPMKHSEVVDDIIGKVSAQKLGVYTYTYKRKIGSQFKVELYELVIYEDISYLHDVEQMKYYTFKDDSK